MIQIIGGLIFFALFEVAADYPVSGALTRLKWQWLRKKAAERRSWRPRKKERPLYDRLSRIKDSADMAGIRIRCWRLTAVEHYHLKVEMGVNEYWACYDRDHERFEPLGAPVDLIKSDDPGRNDLENYPPKR